MKQQLYFAYGSNLNDARMEWRCPDSVPLFAATLPGYRLTFQSNGRSGVANVVKDPGGSVPGFCYMLTKRCMETLDRFEGVPTTYDRMFVTVTGARGHKVEAMTYAMVGAPPVDLPDEPYFALIYDGYKTKTLDRYALTQAVLDTARIVEENGYVHAPKAPKKRRKKAKTVTPTGA